VDDLTASSIMEVLTECLTDKNLEVRDLASSCLSTVLRCSQRASIVVFKNRFQKTIRETHIPRRRLANGEQDPAYTAALTQMHAAVLGVGSIVEAFPYTVPRYVPELLAETLAAHASDPIPVSTTVRKVAAAFKASHQDTWENEDKKRFTEDQLASLTSILSGTSYYA
jgi:proteasome activator subunit 4